MQTVEVKGKQFTVNQSVQVIENYSVGDPVRILKKEYSEYKAFSGVIVSIDLFKKTPAVNVLYLREDYGNSDVKMVTISELDNETEIYPVSEIDPLLSRGMIMNALDEKINKARIEYESLVDKKGKISAVLDRIYKNDK